MVNNTDVLKAYEQFISTPTTDNKIKEDREGQRIATWNLVEMALSDSPQALALQAPTGTGKSYAALIAGVEGARVGRRTAIGTATVLLSEQYSDEIKEMLHVFPDVKFFILKGASHYLCGNKISSHLNRLEKKSRDKFIKAKAELDAWIGGLSTASVPPKWAQADSEGCYDCRKSSATKALACEYAVARAKAREADVVVTSHAMLMIDLSFKRSNIDKDEEERSSDILGDLDTFIFDEAHKLGGLLKESALSVWDLRRLQRANILLSSMSYDRIADLTEHFESLDSNNTSKKYSIQDSWAQESNIKSLATKALALFPNENELKNMKIVIRSSMADTLNGEDKFECIKSVYAFEDIRNALEQIVEYEDISGDIAVWCDGNKYCSKEMEIRPWFSETLSNYRVCYLSATLGVDMKGKELYTLDNLGINPDYFIPVESAFDYSEQMEVAEVDWKRMEANGQMGLIECSHWFSNRLAGGTVVLTNGHQTKNWIERSLNSRGLSCRAQTDGGGSAKKNEAIRKEHRAFAEEGIEGQVLVGVDIFSTGMNLPGVSLTKLFVHGIKQIREDKPYIEWRKRWLESQGKDGFLDYELPEKAIVLEQQIGRLIRNKNDWGVALLCYRLENPKEKAVVELALSAFDGYNRVELVDVGKRWWPSVE